MVDFLGVSKEDGGELFFPPTGGKSTKHLCRFFTSHFTQPQALPSRDIDSAHHKEQLVGIRRGKGRLEFSGLQKQLCRRRAASRDGSLLEGSGFESPNLSVLEVEKTQDASSLPRRYAQSIALRSPNTRAQRRETENQRRAARKRVKVAKESKKLCFLAKFRAFRAFPILSARCHALSRRLRCP